MRLHCVMFGSEAIALLTYREVPGSKLGRGSFQAFLTSDKQILSWYLQ